MKTFFVVMDDRDKPIAAFEDLLEAVRDLDDRVRDTGKYLKVEAVLANNPEDAAAKVEDGYLKVFDSNMDEPAWFPDLDPDKRTYFVVQMGDGFWTLHISTELADALDVWYYYFKKLKTHDPEELNVIAVYADRPPDEHRPEAYITIWNADRHFAKDNALSKKFKPKRRVVARLQRGGFPAPKDWSPIGEILSGRQ